MRFDPIHAVANAESNLFVCQKCGDCCRGYGGTVVTAKDIKTIARYLKIPVDTFLRQFCQVSGSKTILIQGDDRYCVFWDGLCGIHPVKPRMCRDWPFIPAVLTDPANWRMMASVCPGMRADMPDAAIQEGVARILGSRRSGATLRERNR
jgi:hypothetical protein